MEATTTKTALATRGKTSHVATMVEAAKGPRPNSRRIAWPRKSTVDITIGQHGPEASRTVEPSTSKIGATIEKVRPPREIGTAIKEQAIVVPIKPPGMPSPAKSEKWDNAKSDSEVDPRTIPPDPRDSNPTWPG
jgi:hypothetical protein